MRPLVLALGVVLLFGVLGGAWLGWRGLQAREELSAAQRLLPTLRQQATDADLDTARSTVAALRAHTNKARELTSDPVWRVGATMPVVGDDIGAVSTMAAAVDELGDSVLQPLVDVAGDITPDSLRPKSGRIDLAPFKEASSSVSSARAALAGTTDKVRGTSSSMIQPLTTARTDLLGQLDDAANLLNPLDDALRLMPGMLGGDGARHYLVLFQNNAEIRATGGMPGAFAVVKADNGAMTMVSQGAPGDLGKFDQPTSPLPQDLERMFGNEPGIYFQDVNFTPNWPWAAARAREMYLFKKGGRLDGVVATDPVALTYLLGDTKLAVGQSKLGANQLLPFLLHQVYLDYAGKAKEQNDLFADVAAGTFGLLSGGDTDAKTLLAGLRKGTDEGRVLLWSSHKAEQDVIATTALAGPLRPAGTGGDADAVDAQSPVVGVFLNGAIPSKMDYFLRQSVEMGAPTCRAGDNVRSTLKIALTNGAPANAGSTLPLDVVGPADYVRKGQNRVQVLVYIPREATMGRLLQDGKPVTYGSGADAGFRTVLTVVTLNPGQPVTLALEVDLPDTGRAPAIRTTPTIATASVTANGWPTTPNGLPESKLISTCAKG